ncbi:MAG TPA: OmpA family protein [Deltaproteobacteria bacterium]|nr:OmpA family protein [Deltaproteobacteria bacterium]
MRRIKISAVVFLFGILTVAGCAPKGQIVLLPDPDGHVGQVDVTSRSGSQTLTNARQETHLNRSDESPSQPGIMSEQQIEKRFGKAIAAQPTPPVHFLLYFYEDSTDLTTASEGLIPQVVAAIKDRKSVDISLVGHADATGTKEYNMTLSRNRAEAVSKIIVARGVDPKHLFITYHGKSDPLIKTPDGVAEPRNRRVEAIVR